jgi:hypothetical protein
LMKPQSWGGDNNNFSPTNRSSKSRSNKVIGPPTVDRTNFGQSFLVNPNMMPLNNQNMNYSLPTFSNQSQIDLNETWVRKKKHVFFIYPYLSSL